MPKRQRLSHEELNELKPTKRLRGALFSLSATPLPAGTAKFACVVSKKIAHRAHERNLLKRRCREAIRVSRPVAFSSVALVFHARKAAAGAPYEAIRRDIADLLQSCQ